MQVAPADARRRNGKPLWRLLIGRYVVQMTTVDIGTKDRSCRSVTTAYVVVQNEKERRRRKVHCKFELRRTPTSSSTCIMLKGTPILENRKPGSLRAILHGASYHVSPFTSLVLVQKLFRAREASTPSPFPSWANDAWFNTDLEGANEVFLAF